MFRYIFESQGDDEILEEILWSLGASSISLDSDDKVIVAIFENPDDSEISRITGSRLLRIEAIEEDDWKNRWFENYNGIQIDNIRVLPYTEAEFHHNDYSGYDVSSNDEIRIYLDPRESFGSGEHPSTIIAVKLINQLHGILKKNNSGKSAENSLDISACNADNEINFSAPDLLNIPFSKILDIGTGTGILSIIAEKLHAEDIFAVEFDDDAFRKAEINISLNKCKNIKLFHSSIQDFTPPIKFKIIFANILCDLHEKIIGNYKAILSDGGYLIVSGISSKWENHLFSLLLKNDFKVFRVECFEDWRGAIFYVSSACR